MTNISHLRTPNVPLARAWNTWDAGRPAEMLFQPLGVRVTPLAFAASTGKATLFPPGPGVRYGRHALDASDVEIELEHAGTALTLAYGKPSGYDLVGSWRTDRTGEWGLRFWFVLCLSCDDGTEWRFDEDAGVAHATIGPRSVAVACAKPPLLVTAHDSLADLVREYETFGYWHLASRASRGRLLALRFNLDEMPENRFAAGIADRLDLATGRAKELTSSPRAGLPAAESGERADADGFDPLAAIRDVVGWNTVWDPVNHRPYMTCSRNWDLKKFGGFGMWLNDMCVNGLLASLFDADQGRENLSAVLYGLTPEGNLPCLLTGNDAWVDRTQTPIAALLVWMIWLRTRSRALLEGAYPVLASNHAWWWRTRDGNANGILEFGSSPTGRGLYQGTRLAAKDESFMDNSPLHDEAEWVPGARTLDCEDVGLNALIALDAEILGLMAEELGLLAEAAAHRETAWRQRQRVSEHFWDAKRKVFANRHWSGRFVRSLAPTSFYPLLCGAADAEQQAAMLALLDDAAKFGGDVVLPSVARDDPAYGDNVYWRGRVWPLLNFLVWLGLRRAGHERHARALVEKGWALFQRAWRDRLCPENFNAETGEGLDQPDTDGFYAWTALLPWMRAAEAMDFSPWDGWTVANGADGDFGPLVTPAGLVSLQRKEGAISLVRRERVLFSTNAPGLLKQIAWEEGRLSLVLPDALPAGMWLRLPRVAPAGVLIARAGDSVIAPVAHGDGAELPLGPAASSVRLIVVWSA